MKWKTEKKVNEAKKSKPLPKIIRKHVHTHTHTLARAHSYYYQE